MKLRAFHTYKALFVFTIFFHLFGNTNACDKPEIDDNLNVKPSNINCITSYEGHVDALEQAFEKAETKILVTNYGSFYPAILKTNLFQKLIPDACQRNVKIYFRYDYKDSGFSTISQAVQDYFDEWGIDAARIPIHAKYVVVDHLLVMNGSFNWLTDLTSPTQFRSTNHSFIYEGKHSYPMIERIWGSLKYHRNKKFGEENKSNYRKAYLYKRNPHNQLSMDYLLENDSKLTYIHTIDEHRLKLLELFERAKDQIIILSPFVAVDGIKTYQRDFVRELLSTVLRKNIGIFFVCLPEHEQKFKKYLGTLANTYSRLKLITYPNFHAKTIIIDDNIFGEGSFNWLCAARDEIYFSYKHEATFLCEGSRAQELIQDFYQTPLGKFITQSTRQTLPVSKKRKRIDEKTIIDSSPTIKKQKIAPINPIIQQSNQFFSDRKEEIKRDMWVHHPFWRQYSPEYSNLVYGKFFEIMSGERFNRPGYCVRINKQQYVRDNAVIEYFKSVEEAKEATYDISNKDQQKPLK